MANYTFVVGKQLKLHGKDTELFHYWDFGDGSTMSNLPNPSHIYPSIGTYLVTHTAQSVCGMCTVSTHTVEIVTSLPYTSTADFGFKLGEEIYFNRKDTELTHAWEFGDGTPISTEVSPIHIYYAQGTYTISHITDSICGTCTVMKTVEILPCTIPECNPIIM